MAKGSGLDKKYLLSDELAEFIGKDKASRKEITKAVWDHIKKHDLQDEEDRRTIIPDDELSPILGSKPFSMMKLAGKFTPHLFEE